MSGQACQRCQCQIEAGDLRCAVCSLPVPEEQQVVDRPLATILRCTTCGAAVAYEVEVQAPRCAFCGAVAQVERPLDPIEQAQWVLPFRVAPEQAQAALRGWLGSLGFFRPSDLAQTATLEALRPLWWVAWIFDARALISWTADSNANRGRAAWAPWAGQTPLDFSRVLVPASRGLSVEECGLLAGDFDLSQAVQSFAGAGPPGVVCEGFELQRSAARATIASAIEQLARGQLRGVIPGSAHRNVRLSVLLESLRTARFALPTYVFAYRYRDKLYRALVHGQNPQVVVGTAPWSIGKILLVSGAVAAALLLLLLALLVASAVAGG